MRDPSRTNAELIKENAALKQKIKELEQSEAERKLAEESKSVSEERYKVLANNIPDIIYSLDSNGNVLTVNSLAFERYGYSEQDSIGKPFIDFIHPEDREFVMRSFFKIKEEQRKITTGLQFRIVAKNGFSYWLELNSRARFDDHGHYRGGDGVLRDITERMRTEQETDILTEIGRLIASTLNIDEVYERFAAETQKLIVFDSLTINLYNFQDNTMCVAYVSGLDIKGRKKGDHLVMEGSLSEAVIRARIGLRIQPVSIDEIVGQFPRLSPVFQAGLRSIMCVPLVSRNEVVGVLHFRTKKPNAYTEQDLRLAERIGMQIAGAIANAQLYSDLQEKEKSLRKSENRYRTLFTRAGEGIFVLSGNGTLIEVNESFAQMHGYSTEEMLHMDLKDFDTPETSQLAPERMRRLLNGEALTFTVEHYHRDGHVIPLEVSASLISSDQASYIQCFHRDIAERIRAEKTLRESEKRYRSLVENAKEAIYVAQDGMIKLVNSAGVEISGYSEQEVISKPFIEFIHPDDRAMVVERHLKRLKGENFESRYAFRFISKNGDIKWIELGATLIDFEGKPATLNFVSDITERKESEALLIMQEKESQMLAKNLEEANIALRVVLSRREEDQRILEEKIQSNVNEIILPFISLLKSTHLENRDKHYLDLLESNLKSILSPFMRNMSNTYKSLTPKEMQVAEMIRKGKNSKDIAEMLYTSVATINTHRNKIRKKLNLKKQKTNLRSHLLSLS
jgi:PAS domain S-box-containing protein